MEQLNEKLELMKENHENFQKFLAALIETLDAIKEGAEFYNHKYADMGKIENMMYCKLDNFRDEIDKYCGTTFDIDYLEEKLYSYEYRMKKLRDNCICIYVTEECKVIIEMDSKDEDTYLVYYGDLMGFLKYNKEYDLWRSITRTEQYRIY